MLTRLLAATTAFALAALPGCIAVDTDYDKLPPGIYRGVFYLDGRLSERVEPDDIAADFELDDVPQGELPVNFEVAYRPDSSLAIAFVNGEERVEASRVEFIRLFTVAKDSLTIHFPLNDSYVTAYHEDGIIEGRFVDESRGDYAIPFTGFYGEAYRFTELEKAPVTDLSGRWATTFGVDEDTEAYPAVGEFEQRGNRLSGTFLTTTGDYRYLEGTVQADRFYLSAFDGGHVFLFAGKVLPDSSLLGIFRSGNHYQTIWTATRDADASLASAEAETVVTDAGPVAVMGFDPGSGRAVSLLDAPGVAGRYKVLSLMGSWCPNCRDEAVYLDSLLETLPADRVAVVGMAYERMRDTARALAAVERFRENLDVGYPIYLAGSADKAEATAGLGFVEEVKSFPTMLVLTPDNRVAYTHTGFTGPATSEYGAFARHFADTLRQIIAR